MNEEDTKIVVVSQQWSFHFY